MSLDKRHHTPIPTAPRKKQRTMASDLPPKQTFRDFDAMFNLEYGHFLVTPLQGGEKKDFCPEMISYERLGKLLLPTMPKDQRTPLLANMHWHPSCHCGQEGHVWLHNIHVKKRLRRRGIGSSMVRELIESMIPFWRQDVTYVCLSPRDVAMEFWKKQGMISVTPDLVNQEPHLANHAWCIPVPADS